jgi:predicted Zn-dependent protease
LNLLKGTAAANAALAGATVITVAFAVIQSVAIDQFIAIQTARPKLEAALAQAQQPVNLNQLLSQPNGSDLSIYYWAKAMEADFVIEDPQLVALAAAAHQQAQSTGYRLALAQ